MLFSLLLSFGIFAIVEIFWFFVVACFQLKIKIRDCSKCWMMRPAFWFKIRFGHNNISHIKPKRQKIICFVARVWKPHLVYSKYIRQNTFQANRLKTKKKKKKNTMYKKTASAQFIVVQKMEMEYRLIGAMDDVSL